MPSSDVLTAKNSIAEWLEHPVGGPVLRGLLAQGGGDASSFAPVMGFPLEQLVPMSQGQLTPEIVANLVAQANPGLSAAEIASAEAEAAGSGKAAAGPGEWEERIVPKRFTGQTVVVTGAGSGIGRATASRVAREGGRVIAVDIVADRLEEFAANHSDQDATTVVADITDPAGIDRILAAAGDTIDSLANIAGIMDNMTPLHEVSDQVWDRVFAINVKGTVNLSRAVLPGMLERHRGSIVNITSEAGLRGSAAGVAYTASKHAIVGITKSSAFMYGPSGIRVNAVAPGGTITGIEARFDSQLGQERIGSFLAGIPAPVLPERLAASITFLLSDDGINLNGVILPSDGGWSAQ